MTEGHYLTAIGEPVANSESCSDICQWTVERIWKFCGHGNNKLFFKELKFVSIYDMLDQEKHVQILKSSQESQETSQITTFVTYSI